MGILESVIGGLLGGGTGSQSGMSGVLSSLLGGQTGASQSGGGLGSGGLGNLVSQLERSGLGDAVQSWIGNGPNQSVSPQDLQNAFGDQGPGMAKQAGMEQGDFFSQLSQHLPNAVNGVTPNGRIDDNGSYNV